jgi:hypothetical protein
VMNARILREGVSVASAPLPMALKGPSNHTATGARHPADVVRDEDRHADHAESHEFPTKFLANFHAGSHADYHATIRSCRNSSVIQITAKSPG